MQARSDPATGRAELRAQRDAAAGLFAAIFLFSVFVNLLMLAGPIFMLQLYDRVLASRSEPTLVALLVLVAFLYAVMAVLDHARARVAARAGARFQAGLDRRVLGAAVAPATPGPDDPAARHALADLEAIQRLLAAPVFLALFDVPWTVIFLLAIFLLHPALGWLAVVAALSLVALALAHRRAVAAPLAQAGTTMAEAEHLGQTLRQHTETLRGLGMRPQALARWQALRTAGLVASLAGSDRSGAFTSASKAWRLFLQSAILALGAWLVLRNQITPGAMIAASILLGRALAPADQAIGQWGTVQRAQEGWDRLCTLLTSRPPEPVRTPLPRPRAEVTVEDIAVAAPGSRRAVLRRCSFRLDPGQALGVIGPSGSGKSSLARALAGIWPIAAGRACLGGAALDQYDPDRLGRLIGYLPQDAVLFDGTVAQNIARLDGDHDPGDVIDAARRAGAHEMILDLPQGYDTPLPGGGGLSGGQVQRIALARALYGHPVLLILDEADSNLDHAGTLALDSAIRQAKSGDAAVVIMAHRPGAIAQCDLLMTLEDGIATAFGPRDRVLREKVRTPAETAAGGAIERAKP